MFHFQNFTKPREDKWFTKVINDFDGNVEDEYLNDALDVTEDVWLDCAIHKIREREEEKQIDQIIDDFCDDVLNGDESPRKIIFESPTMSMTNFIRGNLDQLRVEDEDIEVEQQSCSDHKVPPLMLKRKSDRISMPENQSDVSIQSLK